MPTVRVCLLKCIVVYILLQILEEACDAYLILDDAAEVSNVDALLLHCVAVTQSDCVVLECLMVDSHAVWSTDGILTAVALADLVFLLILTVEVELQTVDNLACLLWQTVLLCEWEYSQLDWSKSCWQMEHGTCLAVLQLLLFVCVAHDREEHTVNTD